MSNPYQCSTCKGDLGHEEWCPNGIVRIPGRCEWCGIHLLWWERLLRFWHCPMCRRALHMDTPGPPVGYQSRRTVCRRYLADHRDYCPGHHSEAYP